MLAIQVAIGAMNDRADAAADASGKPAKPIPAGLASGRDALMAAIAAAGIGLVLAAVSGVPTLAVALAGLGLGLAYDLGLSRTRWSWLPLALALPLLPVFAWLGASGSVPAGLLGLLPTGVLAGAALALANGLVDLERDAGTGRPAIAVALGRGRAWSLHALLLLGVAVLAIFLAPAVSSAAPGQLQSGGVARISEEALRWLRQWGMVLGIGALLLGAAVLRAARPALRERGWELEAIGVAGIGLGWLAGTAATAFGGS
jgi:4-hydroxybenzoate polyprenyltransferase